MFFYPCLKLRTRRKFYLWHLKRKGPDWLDCRLYCMPQQWCIIIAGVFFPLKLGLVPGRNDTCVTQMQHRAHHCFKTLNFPIEILPALLFSCSAHDTAKTCLFTHCESPLQTDKDHHLNLTFGISASEWDFQSYEDNSYIPLLLWLVKAVLRSYSKCQIDRYTKNSRN